jgi:hypothetical protein
MRCYFRYIVSVTILHKLQYLFSTRHFFWPTRRPLFLVSRAVYHLLIGSRSNHVLSPSHPSKYRRVVSITVYWHASRFCLTLLSRAAPLVCFIAFVSPLGPHTSMARSFLVLSGTGLCMGRWESSSVSPISHDPGQRAHHSWLAKDVYSYNFPGDRKSIKLLGTGILYDLHRSSLKQTLCSIRCIFPRNITDST